MRSKKTGLRIRPLRKDELTLMLDVWTRAGLPYRPRGRDSMSNLARQLKQNPESFIGAFVDGDLIGVTIISDDGRKGWINRLAVVPEGRGRGIARRLIRYSEDLLRKRGRRLFCVQIESYNKSSMELFKKAGYSKEEDILYFTKRELKSY
ncbi:MAG TPA: GNAT family N-acetyltransferase [Thermoplasmata archaeon]|jgi:ribosomal protein S18 acetylase RimI-like enzyme